MRREKLRRVAMLVCDVDGVMTDGGLYYDLQGHISKKFHVQDGFGVKLAQSAGLEIAVLTGLDSDAVRKRLEGLDIWQYYAGKQNKREPLLQIAAEKDYSMDQLAYLGDDWVDVPAMVEVGVPIAVANAQPEVKAVAEFVTQTPGGHGALREAIVCLLKAQDLFSTVWRQWTQQDADGFI